MELHQQRADISETQWLQSLGCCTQEGGYKTVCNHLLCGWQEEFLLTMWEKGPVLFNNLREERINPIDCIFSRLFLISTCEKEAIPYGNNMNVVKYTTGVKSSQEYPFNDPIDSKNLAKLFKKGYTVQFFQPQRFSDCLHSICAGFEYIFGTLAGASAYLTPANAQGLAPHWDDVEVFIVQTEGKKLWRLWKPISKLSETYSHDLSRDKLGPPDVEITISPGDVLYLPRGTIHEAIALNSFSTHVTISVYQKYNVKSLIEKMVPYLLEKLFERCDGCSGTIDVRRGLPIQMASLLGTSAAQTVNCKGDCAVSAVTQRSALPEEFAHSSHSTSCADLRAKYREYIATAVSELGNCVTSEIIDIAADTFGSDFCLHRLPEPKSSGGQNGTPISTSVDTVESALRLQSRLSSVHRSGGECLLRICDPRLMHITIQEVDGVSLMLIGSGRENNRANHMGHPSLVSEDTVEEGEGECGDESADGDDIEEQSEVNSEEGNGIGENDWVQVSLPSRAHQIVTALSRPFREAPHEYDIDRNGFVVFSRLLQDLNGGFDEEEVSLIVFVLCCFTAGCVENVLIEYFMFKLCELLTELQNVGLLEFQFVDGPVESVPQKKSSKKRPPEILYMDNSSKVEQSTGNSKKNKSSIVTDQVAIEVIDLKSLATLRQTSIQDISITKKKKSTTSKKRNAPIAVIGSSGNVDGVEIIDLKTIATLRNAL